MTDTTYVFTYGSLVDVGNLSRFMGGIILERGQHVYCKLRGYRRCWRVAMDNKLDMPGYKYFVDRNTGDRIDGYVTFLTIRPDPAGFVNGVAIEFNPNALGRLDRRERNYNRIDVTPNVNPPLSSLVWVYIAKPEGVERFERGRAEGTAVISRSYLGVVENAFRSRGEEAFETYCATTDAPEVPIRDLRRIDLSSEGDRAARKLRFRSSR